MPAVSGFSADWLALRESADAAARNPALGAALCEWRQKKGAITIVDLGAGTGANARYLAPRLGGRQRWILIDRDPHLLDRAHRTWPGGIRVETRCRDLRDFIAEPAPRRPDLVTAAALLDLVSQDFAERLADYVTRAGAAFIATLTYDGRIAWHPGDPLDETLRTLVNRHQRGDKGFGPALGPAAAQCLAAAFEARGYQAAVAPSDWRIDPDQARMQRALLDDWARAAREIDPGQAPAIADWLARRQAMVRAGACRLSVGHLDLFARP